MLRWISRDQLALGSKYWDILYNPQTVSPAKIWLFLVYDGHCPQFLLCLASFPACKVGWIYRSVVSVSQDGWRPTHDLSFMRGIGTSDPVFCHGMTRDDVLSVHFPEITSWLADSYVKMLKLIAIPCNVLVSQSIVKNTPINVVTSQWE